MDILKLTVCARTLPRMGIEANSGLRRLGSISGVNCWIAVSRTPWNLPIEAIVLSVGRGLGDLGAAVANQYRGVDWGRVDYGQIRPDAPELLPLPEVPGRSLDLAVLASTKPSPGLDPDASSIRTAARASVLAASRSRSIGISLLAAGALGFPVTESALAVVTGAVDALHSAEHKALGDLVFLCGEAEASEAVRAAWRTVPPPELAGGISTDLVDPNQALPLSEDQLGIAPYVSMLASVITARDTPLPLSIGVFGDWGSGKSTFMAMLRGQVDALAGTDPRRWCGQVVQIGFNAWHYTDSNLWASLADEIFTRLAGPGQSPQDRAERLRVELAALLDERRRLTAATEQARATVARLRAEVDTSRSRSVRELLTALRRSKTVRTEVDQVWRQLGVSGEVEQARLLAEQLRGTVDEAEALRRVPRTRQGKLVLAAATLVLGGGLIAPLLAPALGPWLAGLGLLGLGTGVGVLANARAGLRKLLALCEELRADLAESAPLREAEAEQQVAQAQLAQVLEQVGELGRQLAQLEPGQRVYSFLAERAASPDYSGKLGLISTIRKDFGQLVELMRRWRAEPDPRVKPIDRVVLYIDDLDRCGPKQVVEVLQAVHLLLAFDLFVVVVGVNPRLLLHSLGRHYEEIIAEHGISPEDYLEKILNIPFVLSRMPRGGLGQLLRALARPVGPAPVTRTPLPAQRSSSGAITIEPGSELDTEQQRPAPARHAPHPLTEPELDLLAALEPLIATPRAAKRLFNLYRMIRATRDLSSSSRFLGEDESPGEYQPVALLLGLLTADPHLFGPVVEAAPGERAGGLAHRSRTELWSRFVADMAPRETELGWGNGILGPITERDLGRWRCLHQGIASASESADDLELRYFQVWVPPIRRFSYALGSSAA
ncbi:hypothetical protein KALB_3689 [Kutzneria albida DSM 43870]|uniref:KAP NTPase domain-containing protein n=2 Tax=Kutzneria TaxID=43356 RepID=W5W7B6_9PSEU|nr:hypothetical protein KALB_3689 [Kutzneria albida DSM 43870]